MESVTKKMVYNVLEQLKTETSKEVFKIKISDDTPRLYESKFGGTPYLPRDAKPPVDHKGNVLRLLAQINMQELPVNEIFPSEGILQFYILNDDFAGVDFDTYGTTDGSRVLFWEHVDTSIRTAEVKERYHPYIQGNVDFFPIENELRLHFIKSLDFISVADYCFEETFIKCWKSLYPNSELKCFKELPEELATPVYEDMSGFGHKLLGYPGFTQEDPRGYEDSLAEYDTLLLQIDSGGTEECEIMWGDSGVGNFFIKKKDLLKHDFTKVIYTWDCC